MQVVSDDHCSMNSAFMLSFINSLTISNLIDSIVLYESSKLEDPCEQPIILWDDIFECSSIEC